jgi:hypothetical protein
MISSMLSVKAAKNQAAEERTVESLDFILQGSR